MTTGFAADHSPSISAAEVVPINQSRIENALAAATDTAHVAIGRGLLSRTAALYQEWFGGRPALVVADAQTYAAAGQAVQAQLEQAGLAAGAPFRFTGAHRLHADIEHADRLAAELRQRDVLPIAVGSGTINDIVKLAAHRSQRPYMVVATAASMDGYTAFGASITTGGFKQTESCPAPRAILADLDVLVAAPLHLAAWGYADLAAKLVAGADWLIADALGVEPVHPAAWALVQEPLRAWIAEPARLREGDPAALDRLIEGLSCTGLAIQMTRSSRPASGAEHQLSHLWEMRGYTHQGEEPSHGFKVGVGSVAMAGFFEHLLQQDFTRLDIAARLACWPSLAEAEAEVRAAHPDPRLADQAWAAVRAKQITREQLARRLERLQTVWPALRQRLFAHLMPAAQFRRYLLEAGCPVRPEQIGVPLADAAASFAPARQIRSRYTALDLAYETGSLQACVHSLLAPGGVWHH